MTVLDIVKQYLTSNGFDGLCTNGCGCGIGDLFPCDFCDKSCQPAKKRICPGDTCPDVEACESGGVKGSDCFYVEEVKLDMYIPGAFGAVDIIFTAGITILFLGLIILLYSGVLK